MTSYLSRLSPVPGFTPYTGPYQVGTIDVELPISELEEPLAAPRDDIPTVQYRIFYPCEASPETHRNPHWLPAPQRGYVSAYTRFLGAGTLLADLLSCLPGILSYITIPAFKNAPVLPSPSKSSRWPVMIFSHGLGGSRNAYSHLVASVASHGMIVIAPEHRDGSCPITYIREVPTTANLSEKRNERLKRRTVDYLRLSHTPSPEVEAGRNAQLKVRLWELGLIYDSIMKLDQGEQLTNLSPTASSLDVFKDTMEVHEPGMVSFAGHSFGAATIAQLIKSTYYAPQNSEAPKSYEILFTPSARSPISTQITPNTPVTLLDVWCLPLRASSTRWLWDKPFPCYAPNGPGGSALLAVESQAFYQWRVHLKATKRLLSPDPTSEIHDYKDNTITQPNFFYATSSAHLSQSDFGVLFPWVTKKIFSADEPERILRLNVRAMLQLVRNQGIEISRTCAADMEMSDTKNEDTLDDKLILNQEGEVRGWNWLSTDFEDLHDVDDEKEALGIGAPALKEMKEPSSAVVGDELLKRKEGANEQLDPERSG